MNVRLLLLLSPVVFSAMAEAQVENSPLAPLFECREIADDVERLSCLDAAVDSLRGDTDSGEIVAVNSAQIEAAEEATFGLTLSGFNLPGIPHLAIPSLSSESLDLDATEEDASSSEINVIRNEEGDIQRIENLPVQSADTNAVNRVVIVLQNGQVWRQIDSVRVLINHREPQNEMTVTIRKTGIGSLFMRLNNRGRWFRVERVD